MKKILFLGGSITCGSGSTEYDKAWARVAYGRIAKPLFGDDVEMINASISGTGSRVAVFRLSEHVLPYHPDLVFVEFAVNDNGASKKDYDQVLTSMDYIVQALKAQNPNVAITFVYTTISNEENASHVHHVVAEHYGIPEIDLRAPLVEKIHAGAQWTDYLNDTAHPNDNGHAFYGNLVAEAVLGDPARYLAPVKDVPSIGTFKFTDPHVEYPSDAWEMNGFSIRPISDRCHNKRLPELVIHEAAVSDRIGDTVTVEFEGENFGVYHQIGNFMGRFSVTIDGEVRGEVEGNHRYGKGTDRNGECISRFYVRSLAPGKHTATITVIEPNPDSEGSDVCIAGIFIG